MTKENINMQCAVKRFAESKENGLCLIDMPTGTGKTFLTAQLIQQFIKKEAFQNFDCVIYLTPLKKNVNDLYKEVKDGFEDNLELFDNSVLILLPNYERVIEKLSDNDFVRSIPDSVRKRQTFKELKVQIDEYNRFVDGGAYTKDLMNNALKDIRTKYEYNFRHDIEIEISRVAKNLKQRKELVFSEEYKWLREMYPSCYSDVRNVLIMTMDKFLATNDPIVDKPYTFLSHLSDKKALIFIDEFDATKDVILNREIEKCIDYKIDIIKLFSTLTASLKGREFPDQLFADSDKSRESFKWMKSMMLDTEKKHDLNYLFKLVDENDTERHFLFDDFQIHTISALDDGKTVSIKNDKSRNQNIIKFEKGKSDESFYSAIYALKIAINNFVHCNAMMARNYKNYQNNLARINGTEFMELDQTVRTITDFYNLDQKLEDVVAELIENDIALPKNERNKDFLDTDFYMNGFRYYDFNDDLYHDASTSILMCFLKNTPERFIISLADKASVVGLSATASIETVTGNYNLDYVKSKLGEKYYSLPQEDEENIKAYVEESLPSKHKIDIHHIQITDEEPADLAKLLFDTEANRELFQGTFEAYQNEDEKNKNFANVRTVKAMLAIKEFIKNEKSKVILVLTTRNVKDNSEEDSYCQKVVSAIVESLSKENGIETPSIYYLFGNEFEKEKQKYLEEVRKGKRIILFSSYPATGTGQNLQYEENSGDNDEMVKKDIDSLYIEMPTNIIVQKKAVKASEGDLIKYIYQMESLRRSGDISKTKSVFNIKQAFKQYMNPSRDEYFDNVPYRSSSANNHIVKTLIQAVGRICRTRRHEFKRDVNIYVDNTIFEKVKFKFIQDKLLNPEFKKIIEQSTLEEKFDVEVIHALNKADELNDRVGKRLNNILSENRSVWSESSMKQWNLIRTTIGQNPTISRQKLEELSKQPGLEHLPDFYIFGLEGRNMKYYSFNPSIEEKQFLFGKTDKEGYICINEEGCRLDVIKNIKFLSIKLRELGYPTFFVPNEGMILPVVYQNIYKGVLGEVIGRIMIESWGFKLAEITDPYAFEKFDFCFEENNKLFVDFKNWANDQDDGKRRKLQNIPEKLEKVNGIRAFVINIFGDDTKPTRIGNVVMVPSLFKKKLGHYFAASFVVSYIKEALHDGNK